ncbi:MAG: NHLP bacteriocin system secretion protein [Alphaproteobacteria bacterium]|nr:NHLP bacteriocin system secretion protein [Alphaproteobacteria bacterium]
MANTGELPGLKDTGSSAKLVGDVAAGPERLQTAIRITTPGSWIIGAVFAFVTIAVIVWGVVGELTTRVGGLGIVLSSDEDIIDLRSVAAGTVIDLPAKIGAQVTKGQLIARIGQPGGESALDAARQRIERMQQNYNQQQSIVRADLENRKSATENHKNSLIEKKNTIIQRSNYLSALLKTAEAELRQRLVTEARVQSIRDDLANARVQLNEIDIQIAQAELDYLEFKDARETDLSRLKQELQTAQDDLETLRQTQSDETLVTAPISGRIISIETRVGDVLAAGSPVARIDSEDTNLGVVGFLKASDGKKVSSGMDVSVSPSTAERAIWGSIKGKVKRVSELPATLASVNALLVNPDLAEEMFGSGPPILVEVELDKDPNTPSGFAWTSGEGPPYDITHGTLSAVSVVVRREAPANLVIPVFWSWVGHGS